MYRVERKGFRVEKGAGELGSRFGFRAGVFRGLGVCVN